MEIRQEEGKDHKEVYKMIKEAFATQSMLMAMNRSWQKL